MPALLPCPNTKCNHPGPLGFNDPSPWGRHFYHGRDCEGAWSYENKWYDTEAEAYKQYKIDYPGKPESWVNAFDAKIIEKDHDKYDRLIQVWREEFC